MTRGQQTTVQGLVPMLVNKVTEIKSCLVTDALAMAIHTTTAQLSRCDINCMSHKAEYVYYLVM